MTPIIIIDYNCCMIFFSLKRFITKLLYNNNDSDCICIRIHRSYYYNHVIVNSVMNVLYDYTNNNREILIYPPLLIYAVCIHVCRLLFIAVAIDNNHLHIHFGLCEHIGTHVHFNGVIYVFLKAVRN